MTLKNKKKRNGVKATKIITKKGNKFAENLIDIFDFDYSIDEKEFLIAPYILRTWTGKIYQTSNYFNNEKVIRAPKLSSSMFYKFEQSNLLESYRNRLVIDWGRSQTYIQKIIDKPVAEIYPKGFVSLFPGWDKVHLSYKELSEIINNPDGNKDWFEYLTRHSGVYVIFDKSTGMQYVGSASGGNGIWSRWEGYARTGHNGNKALKLLAKKNPDFANNFTFSLHHVFPRTVSKNDVLYYESLLKNKLGSRAYGLNEN